MTERTRSKITCFFGAAIIFLLTGPAHAQQEADKSARIVPPAPKIAIVDVEVALREAKAVQSVRSQLNEISAKYKKEIDAEEAELRAIDQELQQQRTILAPEVFVQRREELQQKAAILQQKARGLRQAMDQGFKETMQKIQKVLFEEISKLAQEMDVNLVIPKSQVIVAVDAFDITRQAIERMDARLSDVRLTLEEKQNTGEKRNQPASPGR